MRKTSILTLLLCMIAALTMTSCLSDDDDDSGLTREEQHTAYLSVAGWSTTTLSSPQNHLRSIPLLRE